MKATSINLKYNPKLEYSVASAKFSPNNCAVIERTADGDSVGVCTFYLKNGIECPRHGIVKIKCD